MVSLLACCVKKFYAALKALPVSHFSFHFHWFLSFWKLELQFDNVTDLNVPGDRGAQSAFSDIFGAAVQHLLPANEDADV